MTAPSSPKPGKALTKSMGRENLTESLANMADLGLGATVSALEGVPVLATFVSMARAGLDVRRELEFKKVVKFLEGVDEAPKEKRAEFAARLDDEGKSEAFGENILLLLSRLDSMCKPLIVGKILAAHINGHINYDGAMRMAAVVDRLYAGDIKYLGSFEISVERKFEVGNIPDADIAAALSAAGLLTVTVIDMGSLNEEGQERASHTYKLSWYGEFLRTHCLRTE